MKASLDDLSPPFQFYAEGDTTVVIAPSGLIWIYDGIQAYIYESIEDGYCTYTIYTIIHVHWDARCP